MFKLGITTDIHTSPDPVMGNKHKLEVQFPRGTHHNCLDQNYPQAMTHGMCSATRYLINVKILFKILTEDDQ